MPRRGDNIRKRKDGRYEGRFSIPGEGKPHSVYARSYQECKAKRTKALREYNPEEHGGKPENVPVDGRALVSLAEKWLAFVEANRKASTYTKYHRIYEKYLKPALNDHAEGIFDCNTEIYDRFGITALSVKKCCVTILNGMIQYSVKSEDLTPETFRLKAQYEPKHRNAVEVFTKEEQKALLKILDEVCDRHKLGIRLCLETGLRLGELCALKWVDVDLHSGVIHVNRTVQRLPIKGGKTKTRLVESAPKTECSRRDVPLSDEMIRLLSECEHTGEYVLGGNRPVEPRTYEYKFRRYQINAGIPVKNFHVLRHSFATNCINFGINAKTVSEIMGHRNVSITLNLYVHPSMESKRAAVNFLSDEYGQMRGQEEKAA